MLTSTAVTVTFNARFGCGKWNDTGCLIQHEDAINGRRRLLIACATQAFQQLGGVKYVRRLIPLFREIFSDHQ